MYNQKAILCMKSIKQTKIYKEKKSLYIFLFFFISNNASLKIKRRWKKNPKYIGTVIRVQQNYINLEIPGRKGMATKGSQPIKLGT